VKVIGVLAFAPADGEISDGTGGGVVSTVKFAVAELVPSVTTMLWAPPLLAGTTKLTEMVPSVLALVVMSVALSHLIVTFAEAVKPAPAMATVAPTLLPVCIVSRIAFDVGVGVGVPPVTVKVAVSVVVPIVTEMECAPVAVPAGIVMMA